MGTRRLMALSMFVFLFVAALSSFVGPANAQLDQQQYVVIYVEFKPADAKAGSRLLDDLASHGLASAGVIRFDVLQQVDRRNFFALFETWSSAQTFAAFQSSSATQAIITQLAPLLEAPLDERDGNLLAGTVNPRIRVDGRGLLLGGGDTIATNGNASVFATLICEAVAPFTQFSTNITGVPLAANGDFRIDDVLVPAPPAVCDSPVLLIRVTPSGAWFAAGIPKVD